MDSKSISRKGVGVRVPSLVPPERTGFPGRHGQPGRLREAVRQAADELGAAILPRLLERLRRRTDEFRDLARRIDRSPERTLADERALAVVERSQAEAHGLGWCLGVLAAGAGADLLVARREREGLSIWVELVAGALAGHALEPGPRALPGVSTRAGEGWEVPFLAGYAFLRAGTALAAGSPLRWTLEHGAARARLGLRSPAPDGALAERLAALVGLVPGAAVGAGPAGWWLDLPAAWLGPPRPWGEVA